MTDQDQLGYRRIESARFDIIVSDAGVSCVVRQASLYQAFKQVSYKAVALDGRRLAVVMTGATMNCFTYYYEYRKSLAQKSERDDRHSSAILHGCHRSADMRLRGGFRQISHPVMQPLMKIHRSRSCSFAMAVVFSSIFEYATRGPCIGQAARRIKDTHMVAASRKIPPGRMKKAGTATKTKTDSNKNKKLLRKTSRKPAADRYSSAFLFDV